MEGKRDNKKKRREKKGQSRPRRKGPKASSHVPRYLKGYSGSKRACYGSWEERVRKERIKNDHIDQTEGTINRSIGLEKAFKTVNGHGSKKGSG